MMRSFTLTPERITTAHHSSAFQLVQMHNAVLEQHWDFVKASLITSLYMYFYKRERVRREHRFPKTWWDHVKQRFAPAWFLKRWPIAETVVTFDVDDVYPGLPVQGVRPVKIAVANRFDILPNKE